MVDWREDIAHHRVYLMVSSVNSLPQHTLLFGAGVPAGEKKKKRKQISHEVALALL